MGERRILLLLAALLAASCAPARAPDCPAPAPSSPVRFAVIGDYGLTGPAEADVAALVSGWNPDFVITVGDNNYPSGDASTIDANVGAYYASFIHPYRGAHGPGASANAFFPALGNHDWLAPDARPYLDYFSGLPGNQRYYDLVRGPVHLFALDSDPSEPDGTSSTSVQALWLKGRLAASAARFRVVFFHHPPYSSSSVHGSTTTMQWPFREWGATAVLAGHDHTYERLEVDGLSYFVNGLGGAPIYAFGTPVAGSQVRYAADHGAQLVVADGSRIEFQFHARNGSLVDSHVIAAQVRCVAGP